MAEISRTCRHCGARLVKWRVPEDATWSEEFFFVCFNDECPYFQRGWSWMKQRYNQHASYRHAVNPRTGASLPIPVWSELAARDFIVDESEGGEG